MSKKYDPGVIREVQARKAELDKIESKRLDDVVCNHIAYPSLFNLRKDARIERLHFNKQPPKGMTGYIYICSDCMLYMENLNEETARRCFQRMHESEFIKNIEQQSKGIII